MAVKVNGLNAILFKLDKLSNPNATANALRAAVRQGADVAKQAVSDNTPVSTDRWTSKSDALPEGTLRDGLIVTEDQGGPRGNPRAIVHYEDAHVGKVGAWVDRGHIRSKAELKRTSKGRITASSKVHISGYTEGTAYFREAVEDISEDVKATVRSKLKAEVDKLIH